jgi:hypothetical protein
VKESNVKGHCYCGAVQFEVNGAPIWVSHCHCQSCRRHTASVMATFAGYYPNQLTYTTAQPASYSSDDGVKRSFCGRCGSPISYESDRWPDQVHLYLGIFDDPDSIQPEDHVYFGEKIAWLNIGDELPRHECSGEGN